MSATSTPPARRRVLDRRSVAQIVDVHTAKRASCGMPSSWCPGHARHRLPRFSCPVHRCFVRPERYVDVSHGRGALCRLDVTARVSLHPQWSSPTKRARRAEGRRRRGPPPPASCCSWRASRVLGPSRKMRALAACNRVSLPRRTSISALDTRGECRRGSSTGSMPRLPCPLGALHWWQDGCGHPRHLLMTGTSISGSSAATAVPAAGSGTGGTPLGDAAAAHVREIRAQGCRLTKRSGRQRQGSPRSGRSPSLHRVCVCCQALPMPL